MRMHKRGRWHRLVLLAVVMGLLLAIATPAFASGGRPRLLTVDYGSTFAVRPATITPTGDGSGVIGRLGKRGRSIHWSSWTTSNAYGTGTLWIDNGIPNVAEGTYHGYGATVHAYRVRDGRFTRMTVRYRKSGKAKLWALALQKSSPGYVWRR